MSKQLELPGCCVMNVDSIAQDVGKPLPKYVGVRAVNPVTYVSRYQSTSDQLGDSPDGHGLVKQYSVGTPVQTESGPVI